MNPEEAIIRQMEEKINKLSEEAHKAMGRRVVRRVEEWAAYGAAVAKRVTELETSNGLMASRLAELNEAWQIRNEEACRLEEENERLRAALAPFTHNALSEMMGGNCDGDNSIVFQRNKAKLTIGDFKAAQEALQEDGK